MPPTIIKAGSVLMHAIWHPKANSHTYTASKKYEHSIVRAITSPNTINPIAATKAIIGLSFDLYLKKFIFNTFTLNCETKLYFNLPAFLSSLAIIMPTTEPIKQRARTATVMPII